jgi:hypothetical protein
MKLQLHECRENCRLAMRDSCPAPEEHRKPRGMQGSPDIENSIRRSTVGKKVDEVLWFCRCERQGIIVDIEGRHNCLPDLLGGDHGAGTTNNREEGPTEISLCLINVRREIHDIERHGVLRPQLQHHLLVRLSRLHPMWRRQSTMRTR